MKKISYNYFVFFALLFCSGCFFLKSSSEEDLIQENASHFFLKGNSKNKNEGILFHLKFEDIPVPKGFKLDFKESFLFSNGQSRVGTLRYFGNQSLRSLSQFFKNQMPLYNWEMINSIEYKRVVLNFEKENQTCTIILEPSKRKKSIINIISGPIGN